MKERFNVEIVDITFSVVTDDGEELVRRAESTLNNDVRAVLKQMGRFSKLDAVTLCALDYCAQAMKAEAKIKNLEAQIEILEKSRKNEEPAAAKAAPAPKAEVKAEEPKAEPKAEAKAEPKAETVASKAEATDDSDGDNARSRKLRQLEALLGSQLKMDLDK